MGHEMSPIRDGPGRSCNLVCRSSGPKQCVLMPIRIRFQDMASNLLRGSASRLELALGDKTVRETLAGFDGLATAFIREDIPHSSAAGTGEKPQLTVNFGVCVMSDPSDFAGAELQVFR